MEMQKFMYSPLCSTCRTLQSRQQIERALRHEPRSDGIDKIQHYCRYDNSAANDNLIMRQIHRQSA